MACHCLKSCCFAPNAEGSCGISQRCLSKLPRQKLAKSSHKLRTGHRLQAFGPLPFWEKSSLYIPQMSDASGGQLAIEGAIKALFVARPLVAWTGGEIRIHTDART